LHGFISHVRATKDEQVANLLCALLTSAQLNSACNPQQGGK